MKMIAMIVDAGGYVHLASTRSPDLLRRQIKAATGVSAHLAFCALAPKGTSCATILEALDARFSDQRSGRGIYRTRAPLILAALRWELVWRPLLAAPYLKVRRIVRRTLRRMVPRAA